jgi:hypothetical protein
VVITDARCQMPDADGMSRSIVSKSPRSLMSGAVENQSAGGDHADRSAMVSELATGNQGGGGAHDE